MKENFVECGTDVDTEILCEACQHRIDDETCPECGGVLVEWADYKRDTWTVVHSGNGGHFCSKECAKEYASKQEDTP